MRCLRRVLWLWPTWSTGCSLALVIMMTASQTQDIKKPCVVWGPVWSGGKRQHLQRLELDKYFVSILRNQINSSVKCYGVSDTDFLVSKSDVQVRLLIICCKIFLQMFCLYFSSFYADSQYLQRSAVWARNHRKWRLCAPVRFVSAFYENFVF